MSEALPQRRRRVRLLTAGIASLLPVLLCGAYPGSIAVQPISRLDTPWWRDRFLQKRMELEAGPVDLLWLGDSITQNWELSGPEPWRNFRPIWAHFYGDRHAVDLGFRGDSTCHLLWRLQNGELDGIAPRATILLIGANNFGHVHTDADQTFDGIVRIIDLVHHRLPATKLILIGVLPSIRSGWIDRNTLRLNQRLAGLPASRSDWLFFVDASPIFESGGRVNPTAFLDPMLTPPDPPLHPSAASQARMAQLIEPLVVKILGDRAH